MEPCALKLFMPFKPGQMQYSKQVAGKITGRRGVLRHIQGRGYNLEMPFGPHSDKLLMFLHNPLRPSSPSLATFLVATTFTTCMEEPFSPKEVDAVSSFEAALEDLLEKRSCTREAVSATSQGRGRCCPLRLSYFLLMQACKSHSFGSPPNNASLKVCLTNPLS